MALTNKQLKEILSRAGVLSDNISNVVDEIMLGHNASIDALKEERDKYKADAEKLPAIQKELNTAREAMANGDKSPYKVKYEAVVEEKDELQKAFDEFKAEVDQRETIAKKTDAYKALLKSAGVSEKRIDAIIRVTDVSVVDLTADGKVKNADDLTDSIKSEWADFIVKTSEQGVQTSNPPQNTGGADKQLTKDEILMIKDTAERQKAWATFLENERK